MTRRHRQRHVLAQRTLRAGTAVHPDRGRDPYPWHLLVTGRLQHVEQAADGLQAATPTIVKTATRMEEAGLLVRKPDPADGRLVRLYLAPLAQSVREPVRNARAELERHATATLTAAERDHLRSALTKIIAQLRDEPPVSSA